MNDLESAEKISIDIKKLERNLKQVEDINFEGKEKEVYDRAVDYLTPFLETLKVWVRVLLKWNSKKGQVTLF